MRKLFAVVLLLFVSSLSFADFHKQVGQFAETTSAGTQTITMTTDGGGWTPKVVILFGHAKTGNAESATASFATGFTDCTNHVYNAWASDDAVATTNSGQSVNSTKTSVVITNGTPTFSVNASVNSVACNAGNFVATFQGTPLSAFLVDYIAIGGSDLTNVAVGTTTTPGSGTTGLQHVTTVGFQPNFIMVINDLQSAGGSTTNSAYAIGAAVSTSKRWACNSITSDAQTTSPNVNAMSWCSSTSFITNQFTNNTLIFNADFSGFTSNGFDYTIGTGSASSYLVGFLAIKGGQWDVGMAAKPSTATTQTVTGEAFQPSLLALFKSSPTAQTTFTSVQDTTFGATDGTNQVYANAVELDAINTTAKSSGSASAVLVDRDGANNPTATFTSFNSGGWTITWGNSGTAALVGWFTAAANSTSFVPGGPFVEIP